jgi:hypothetical protein
MERRMNRVSNLLAYVGTSSTYCFGFDFTFFYGSNSYLELSHNLSTSFQSRQEHIKIMGLLKHVLLPGFGLMHAASAAACSDLKGWAKLVGLQDDILEEDEKSVRQNHMLGVVRGFNLAMMTLCALGVFKEHAHFRGQIILAEFVLFATAAVDAFRLGGLNYIVPGASALAALGGFIVHSLEPGIFTKDKSA